MYLDKSNIKQVSNKHLKKIRSKKISGGTDIFRLLPELRSSVTKDTFVLPTQSQVQAPLTKYQLIDFNSLLSVYKMGELRKKKAFRRLSHLFVLQGLEVPDDISKYTRKSKPRFHTKRKQLVFKKKKERCPKSYKLYIKSKFWEERKNAFYQIHGHKCAICGSSYKMSVHHLKYGKYGEEQDEDLVGLCWSCHEEFHSIYGVSRDCHKEFAEFCASKVNNPYFS